MGLSELCVKISTAVDALKKTMKKTLSAKDLLVLQNTSLETVADAKNTMVRIKFQNNAKERAKTVDDANKRKSLIEFQSRDKSNEEQEDQEEDVELIDVSIDVVE